MPCGPKVAVTEGRKVACDATERPQQHLKKGRRRKVVEINSAAKKFG